MGKYAKSIIDLMRFSMNFQKLAKTKQHKNPK